MRILDFATRLMSDKNRHFIIFLTLLFYQFCVFHSKNGMYDINLHLSEIIKDIVTKSNICELMLNMIPFRFKFLLVYIYFLFLNHI